MSKRFSLKVFRDRNLAGAKRLGRENIIGLG
jgi:hypothetical protein